MWKLILFVSLFWFFWRVWTKIKAWREAIARITFNAQQQARRAAPSNFQEEEQAHSSPYSDPHYSPSRIVKCDRCGIHVPMNEVRRTPESTEQDLHYVCYPACSTDATKAAL